MSQFTGSFAGYTMFRGDEGTRLSEEELAVRERARLANRIYQKICSDSGLDRCFFKNFSAWSDYVNGKIGESEFAAIRRSPISGFRPPTSFYGCKAMKP